MRYGHQEDTLGLLPPHGLRPEIAGRWRGASRRPVPGGDRSPCITTCPAARASTAPAPLCPVRGLQAQRHHGRIRPLRRRFREYVKALDWIVAGARSPCRRACSRGAGFVEPVNTFSGGARAGVERAGRAVGGRGRSVCCCAALPWSGADVFASDTLPIGARSRGSGASASSTPPATCPRGARADRRPWPDCVFLAALGQKASTGVLTPRGPAAVHCVRRDLPGETARWTWAPWRLRKEILTSYSASWNVRTWLPAWIRREVRVRELVIHRFPLEQSRARRRGSSRPPRRPEGRPAGTPEETAR